MKDGDNMHRKKWGLEARRPSSARKFLGEEAASSSGPDAGAKSHGRKKKPPPMPEGWPAPHLACLVLPGVRAAIPWLLLL